MASSNYISIAKHYNKIDFNNWRNHVWWENGEWKEFLPIEEHHRWDKFYHQACKNVHNKYEKSMGYHFVEVLEMRDFKKNGYKWLYENYYLFRNARPTEQKFYNGTEKIKQIIGTSKIAMLHNIVSSMKNKAFEPTEPDLFAYKKNYNGEDKYDMIFVEAKRKDKLRENQLFGFELINKYLKINIRVVRYFE